MTLIIQRVYGTKRGQMRITQNPSLKFHPEGIRLGRDLSQPDIAHKGIT